MKESLPTNTSEYIPYKSVSCNLLVNPNHKDYPFFSGTGFFAHFPPFDYIFYITAKHCFKTYSDSEIIDNLLIPYNTEKENDLSNYVRFSEYLITKYHHLDDELEDIIIFIVDQNINEAEKNLLKERSLKLTHQDDVDSLIEDLCIANQNIRTVGFPSISKKIDYENMRGNIEARGFYGKIANNSKLKNRYGLENPSWKEKNFEGFSGSPIIALLSIPFTSHVEVRVIGILLTATSSRGEFLSINVATNLIAEYIKKTCTPIQALSQLTTQ